ncbi:MAG: SOS response-associated peptidase [Dehalococcoidia bacterium]
MCGRYSLGEFSDIQLRFLLDGLSMAVPKRFNIAPSEIAPVVLRNSPNHLEMIAWGVMPRWAKEKPGARLLINARAETVADAKTFSRAFRTRRVIVPATGWYEWKSTSSGKQPYYFRRSDGELIGFAGLLLDGADGPGFIIITTEPNALAAEVHNRMPAILDRQDEDAWLDPDLDDPQALLPMLRPYDEDQMVAFPVSRRVNRAGIDDPALVQPVA